MERYNPQNSEEEKHEILGNLYLASSVRELIFSTSFRMDDIQKREIHVRDNKIQARLTLAETVAGYPSFVYIHDLIHGAENVSVHTRRNITILDEPEPAEACVLEIPEQFNIGDLRGSWESDIIVLARYDAERKRDEYKLARYLDEVLKNPKLSLASRIMKPRLLGL